MSIPKKIIETIKNKDYKFTKIELITKGINSQIYKVITNNGIFALKLYPNSKDNKVNRLSHELAFLKFFKYINIHNVPKLVEFDKEENWILLSWINGKKINNPNETHTVALTEFICSLQKFRESKVALELPNASESGFSINDHYYIVERKLILLKKKFVKSILENKIIYEVFNNLNSIHSELKSIKKNYDDSLLWNLRIQKRNQIISLSDVGFHNILVEEEKCFFLDFEYAGWDDPLKLISDILLQPSSSIPKNQFNLIFKLLEKNSIYLENFKIRLIIMLKIHRIKWIAIIINKIAIVEDVNYEKIDFLKKYLDQSIEKIKFVETNL